ncbi:TPA: hypothetical protein DDZ75_01120 [Patescibacteria group bacterium]|nr:hypothetical protein [Patescibacteria group bacterium]
MQPKNFIEKPPLKILFMLSLFQKTVQFLLFIRLLRKKSRIIKRIARIYIIIKTTQKPDFVGFSWVTSRNLTYWETHGFPIPSSTGKLEFPRPLSCSNPASHKIKS